MYSNKDHKVNITGYLPIKTIDMLDELAKANHCSRNTLIEEAMSDFLIKKKEEIAELGLFQF